MLLLLDTHVLLALFDRERHKVPERMIAMLRTADTQALVSTASVWEIAIKYRLGKLDLAYAPDEIPKRLAQLPGITTLDVSLDHVLREVSPWPATKDPFDRLLLATADVEQAKLLTVDEKLSDHPLAWRPA